MRCITAEISLSAYACLSSLLSLICRDWLKIWQMLQVNSDAWVVAGRNVLEAKDALTADSINVTH